jgi:hypothetical protein
MLYTLLKKKKIHLTWSKSLILTSVQNRIRNYLESRIRIWNYLLSRIRIKIRKNSFWIRHTGCYSWSDLWGPPCPPSGRSCSWTSASSRPPSSPSSMSVIQFSYFWRQNCEWSVENKRGIWAFRITVRTKAIHVKS